jgi:hypothetical protein
MEAMETCPARGAHFPAKEAWAYRSGLGVLLGNWQELDTRVRCPACDHIFQAEAIRYFGFLSPTGMKILVYGLTGAIVVGVAFGLIGR